MKIVLDYRHPSPSHCIVAVFVNGALAGTLRLRQDEIVGFQQIVAHGCAKGIDTFLGTGNPNPPGAPEGWDGGAWPPPAAAGDEP